VAWWVVGTSAAVADMSATLVRRTDGFKHAFERHAGNAGFCRPLTVYIASSGSERAFDDEEACDVRS